MGASRQCFRRGPDRGHPAPTAGEAPGEGLGPGLLPLVELSKVWAWLKIQKRPGQTAGFWYRFFEPQPSLEKDFQLPTLVAPAKLIKQSAEANKNTQIGRERVSPLVMADPYQDLLPQARILKPTCVVQALELEDFIGSVQRERHQPLGACDF